METHHEEIEINNEVTETVAHATPEPVNPPPSTTETTHEASGQVESENENESGEDSDDDERRSDVDEGKHSDVHHQSSTVKSDVRSECDDGLRLDSDGKCVGEYN